MPRELRVPQKQLKTYFPEKRIYDFISGIHDFVATFDVGRSIVELNEAHCQANYASITSRERKKRK